jgi:hypothetical protein
LFVLNGDEKSYGVKNNTIKRNNSTLAGKKSARRDRRNLHGVPSVPSAGMNVETSGNAKRKYAGFQR